MVAPISSTKENAERGVGTEKKSDEKMKLMK